MPAYQPESAAPEPLDPEAQARLDDWDRHGYPAIFINYRNRRDGAPRQYAGDVWASVVLDEYLSGWFGRRAVLRASRSVPRCSGYPVLLRRAVAECRVFLPIIGVDWEESLPSHPWVIEEWRIAKEAGKIILPVILREETPPPAVQAAGSNLDPLVSDMAGLPLGARHTRDEAFEIAREIVARAPDIQIPKRRHSGL